MRMGVEVAITLHYMLRSFRIPVTSPASTMGDYEDTITIASTPE